MADDPLSVFRKPPITPRAITSAPSSPIPIPQPHPDDRRQEYKAFEGKDRVDGIKLRRRKGAISYILMYSYIHSVGFDDDDETCLILIVSGYHIEIRGRNLNRIADAIQGHYCSSIQEFRADRFVLPEPIDPSVTIVESISVEIVHGNGEREPG
jgi:hypothetical protein